MIRATFKVIELLSNVRACGILITGHNLALSVHFMILNPRNGILVLTANMPFYFGGNYENKKFVTFFYKNDIYFYCV